LLAESLDTILSIEGFDGFVTSTAAPIASGWSDQLPGGAFTRWETNTFHGALNNPGEQGKFNPGPCLRCGLVWDHE
jgi:hypothetical protein